MGVHGAKAEAVEPLSSEAACAHVQHATFALQHGTWNMKNNKISTRMTSSLTTSHQNKPSIQHPRPDLSNLSNDPYITFRLHTTCQKYRSLPLHYLKLKEIAHSFAPCGNYRLSTGQHIMIAMQSCSTHCSLLASYPTLTEAQRGILLMRALTGKASSILEAFTEPNPSYQKLHQALLDRFPRCPRSTQLKKLQYERLQQEDNESLPAWRERVVQASWDAFGERRKRDTIDKFVNNMRNPAIRCHVAVKQCTTGTPTRHGLPDSPWR